MEIKGKAATRQPVRPSQGPLKSTWHRQDNTKGWGLYHWLVHTIDIDPLPPSSTTIVHDKNDSIPVWNNLSAHLFILLRFGAAFAVQYAYTHLTGRNFTSLVNMLFWGAYTSLYGINVIHSTRRVAGEVGFLQPNKARDGIPDHRVGEVLRSLAMTGILRPVAATLLCYNPSDAMRVSPWLPVLIPAFSIAVDFWFYWYHRLMHESESLWKFHRTHHTAKLPTTVLALYADGVQEWFDVLVIPMLAHFTVKTVLPMGFYDWMLCWSYVELLELMGHSGIRCAGTAPAFDYLPLRRLDMDIVIEDHDLHHSKGWKTSGNYGKQTRIFDKLFGTVMPRVEMLEHLIDTGDKVWFPQW
ncbi:putative sphingosine hydroxylase [Pseudozyma hubeiensis]|nr:putative sphingosine hydroxylase [Pseudozyma hubeiensis]